MEGDAGKGLSVRLGNLRARRVVFRGKWELQEQCCRSVHLAARCGLDGLLPRSLLQGVGVGLSVGAPQLLAQDPGSARGRHGGTGA